MRENNQLVINGTSIAPGETKTILVGMPKMYDWTPMHMPIHVVRGKEDGPILGVTATVHGDELNGVEIVRRLLKKTFLKKIKGTLIAVPIVNVYGFLYQDRYLMDRRDLNRCFPGSEKGSLASRLAYLVMNEIVENSTHLIDLHTGSLHRSNLPQIRANIESPEVKEMATNFAAPIILQSKERDGSMRQSASEKGKPLLLYEAGEALRFDEMSIRMGVKGIVNVMRGLGMTTAATSSKDEQYQPPIAHSSYWVRAPSSGIMRIHRSLGKSVKKGQVLAVLTNPISRQEDKVIAKEAGIVIGKSNLPLAHEGAALFHIACFDELKEVETDIKDLHYSFEVEEEHFSKIISNDELLGG